MPQENGCGTHPPHRRRKFHVECRRVSILVGEWSGHIGQKAILFFAVSGGAVLKREISSKAVFFSPVKVLACSKSGVGAQQPGFRAIGLVETVGCFRNLCVNRSTGPGMKQEGSDAHAAACLRSAILKPRMGTRKIIIFVDDASVFECRKAALTRSSFLFVSSPLTLGYRNRRSRTSHGAGAAALWWRTPVVFDGCRHAAATTDHRRTSRGN